MDLRPYMKRIETALGAVRAADRIQEQPWFDVVMKELNAISRDLASDLQTELSLAWDKRTYQLGLHEAPPTRLLALEIALGAWLGWVMHQKHPKPEQLLSAEDCVRRVQDAFVFGISLSKTEQRP